MEIVKTKSGKIIKVVSHQEEKNILTVSDEENVMKAVCGEKIGTIVK